MSDTPDTEPPARPIMPNGDPMFDVYAGLYDLMSVKDDPPPTMPPKSSRVVINSTTPIPIVSDTFVGEMVCIHRTPSSEDPFPYSNYMGKKRRRWELRWQGKFLKKPSSTLLFGIEATQPLPQLGFMARSGVKIILSIAARLAAARGSRLVTNYPNSDPDINTNFLFPLTSADTVIVNDLDTAKDDLPDITVDTVLNGRVTPNYEFDTEHIYTFCYFSMYLDFITWDLRNLPAVSGKSLTTFVGHQPFHIVVRDDSETYYMDILLAHRCLSPVWLDHVTPEHTGPVSSSLRKRMSRLNSIDSNMEFLSCHSFGDSDDGVSTSSSNDVVSVIEVVDIIDKKGKDGKTTEKVIITRKVKMRKRDVVLSPLRLAKRAWFRAFSPCYASRPPMRRARSMSLAEPLTRMASVSSPRHVSDDVPPKMRQVIEEPVKG